MALVACYDCDNQVSDSAASCPKCGAPVRREPVGNQLRCPFCSSPIAAFASVCPGCRAQKGFVSWGGEAFGSTGMIVFGVALPILLAVLASFVAFPGAPIVRGVMVVYLIFSVPLTAYRLLRGPVWFKSRKVD